MKNKIKFLTLFSIFIGVFLFAGDSNAGYGHEKSADVYIGQQQIYSGNLYRFGKTVNIDGKVDGDVIVFAYQVNVNGEINGDLIAFTKYLNVKGIVRGDMRVFTQSAWVSGGVGRNLNLFAEDVKFQKEARILGHSLVFAKNFSHEGIIGKDLEGGFQNFDFKGAVQGNAKISVDEFTVSPHARIRGSLTYKGSRNFDINQLVVGGKTNVKVVSGKHSWDKSHQEKKKMIMGFFTRIYFIYLMSLLIGLWLVGWFLIHFFPKKIDKVHSIMKKSVWKSFGIGLAIVLLSPIIVMVLMLSVIGIPLAILWISIMVILCMLSQIFVGLWLGKLILGYKKGFFKRKKVSLIRCLVLGVFLYVIIFGIPFFGPIICGLVSCWALGSMIIYDSQLLKKGL